MLLLKENTKALAEKVRGLQNSRYKILVLWSKFGTDKTTLVSELCKSISGKYVDVSSELLPRIQKPVLGAYGASELLRWIDSQLSQTEHVVCFDEIEGLLATFGQTEATKFFEVLVELETHQVGIVATYLGNELTRANFPKERIYQLRS